MSSIRAAIVGLATIPLLSSIAYSGVPARRNPATLPGVEVVAITPVRGGGYFVHYDITNPTTFPVFLLDREPISSWSMNYASMVRNRPPLPYCEGYDHIVLHPGDRVRFLSRVATGYTRSYSAWDKAFPERLSLRFYYRLAPLDCSSSREIEAEATVKVDSLPLRQPMRAQWVKKPGKPGT